jgi:hypothetical protein
VVVARPGLADDARSDLHTIVTRTGQSLRGLLDTFTRKYPVEVIGHVVRSLVLLITPP